MSMLTTFVKPTLIQRVKNGLNSQTNTRNLGDYDDPIPGGKPVNTIT